MYPTWDQDPLPTPNPRIWAIILLTFARDAWSGFVKSAPAASGPLHPPIDLLTPILRRALLPLCSKLATKSQSFQFHSERKVHTRTEDWPETTYNQSCVIASWVFDSRKQEVQRYEPNSEDGVMSRIVFLIYIVRLRLILIYIYTYHVYTVQFVLRVQ